MNTCIHYVLDILNYTMGLGKKQGLKRCMIFINLKGMEEYDRTVTSRPLARGGQKILPKLYNISMMESMSIKLTLFQESYISLIYKR